MLLVNVKQPTVGRACLVSVGRFPGDDGGSCSHP